MTGERLSPSEEFELIYCAKQGDRAATERLFLCYDALLVSLSKRIAFLPQMREEIQQAGALGMLMAIRKYDPACNTRLITYAVPWILGEMKKVIRSQELPAFSTDSAPEDWRRLSEVLCEDNEADIEGMDLRMAMAHLNEDERKVICLRYFRDKTQKEAAVLIKKSQAQISRIENHALDKLRELLC